MDPQNKPDNKKLKDLTVKTFTIKNKDAKSGIVPFKAESVTIQEGEVILIFNESDAPKWTCSEPFPITIAKGTEKILTFQTVATQNYKFWEKTVTVKCTNLELLTVANFKVHGQPVINDSVTLDESLGQVIQGNIDFSFTQTGADVPSPKYTGLPITLKAGEDKTFTISTDATAKYELFTRTVTVKVKKEEPKPKSRLNVKILTVHGLPAGSGAVTIPTDKTAVTKGNITLEFIEEGEGVPTDFTLSPDPANIAKAGEKVTITVSTAETAKYAAWNRTIEVTRAKAEGAEKTIDDCVASLTSQLTWAGTAVDKPISLPTTVTGYDACTVEWSCEDEHIYIATGKIKQDLADVTVETKAKVTWKGQVKTVTFTVTVQRLKRIKWITEDGGGRQTECIIDLSKEGVLLYSENNEPRLEFEIKNIDVKAKKFIAKLTRKGAPNVLKTIDEILESQTKYVSEYFAKLFGDKYVELQNKTGITWEDFKPYFAVNAPPNLNDEELFGYFKRDSGYQGSLSDFNGLASNERDKIVKDYLKKQKDNVSEFLGLSKDLSIQEFTQKAIEKQIKLMTINKKYQAKEFTYKYKLEEKNDITNFPDAYSFEAESVYDSQRQWYDQLGAYVNANKTQSMKIEEYMNELNISVSLRLGENNVFFVQASAIPVSLSFVALNVAGDTVKKLNCTISNIENGKLTLATTGYHAGTYNLEFASISIFDFKRMF